MKAQLIPILAMFHITVFTVSSTAANWTPSSYPLGVAQSIWPLNSSTIALSNLNETPKSTGDNIGWVYSNKGDLIKRPNLLLLLFALFNLLLSI